MLSHSRNHTQSRRDNKGLTSLRNSRPQPSGAQIRNSGRLSTTESFDSFFFSFRDKFQKPNRHFCHHREAYNQISRYAFIACVHSAEGTTWLLTYYNSLADKIFSWFLHQQYRLRFRQPRKRTILVLSLFRTSGVEYPPTAQIYPALTTAFRSTTGFSIM